MPFLLDPILPPGSLRALDQPVLSIDGELTLRPWRHEDAPVVREAFDCPQIQHWHTRRIDSDEEALAWTARWAKDWHDETHVSWAIARGDQAIGQVGLRGIDMVSAVAELSYWMLPEARGAGVTARAVRVMTTWCFDVARFHRLFLKHSTANMASCRVATAAGYAPEGTLRGLMLHADGWHDAHVHARLRTDPQDLQDEGNHDGSA